MPGFFVVAACESRRVGKATTSAEASISEGGSVPTIACSVKRVGTALARLCPPYAAEHVARRLRLIRGPRDVPQVLRIEAVGVAGRLVVVEGVERTIAIGPHPAAVAAHDHGEIADRLRVLCRGQ